MIITNDILIKDISGNTTTDEAKAVLEWKKLPENNKRYNELKMIWEKSTRTKRSMTPNIDLAWGNVSKNIQQSRSNSFSVLKIAATIALIATLGAVIAFFTLSKNTEESNVITENIPEEVIEKDNSAPVKTFHISARDSIKEEFLQDSSLVLLNTNSKITYKDFFASGTRKLHLEGQAHFDVVPNDHDFIILTDEVIVKVLGTTFAVNENKEAGTIDIIVEEGKVEAHEAGKSKNKVTITGNEKYTYNIKEHSFTKAESFKKEKWWKGFFSKLRKLIDRIKHRKTDKK